MGIRRTPSHAPSVPALVRGCARVHAAAGHTLLEHVETQFLAAQVKAPATYLATAIHHPWLQSYYERGGYVPFDRSTNALGTPLVWLRKILIPDLYEDPATADAPPERLPVPVNA